MDNRPYVLMTGADLPPLFSSTPSVPRLPHSAYLSSVYRQITELGAVILPVPTEMTGSQHSHSYKPSPTKSHHLIPVNIFGFCKRLIGNVW